MDKATLKSRLNSFTVETPSWGLANSGTRFGTFRQPWAAKSLDEKLADAGQVQKFTGICPRVALHIPWDMSDNWGSVQAMAKTNGVQIGAINPNVFQDELYQFGSICHTDAAVRQKAIAHHIECIEIAKATGVSQSTLSKFVLGTRPGLSFDAMDRIGEYLGLVIVKKQPKKRGATRGNAR